MSAHAITLRLPSQLFSQLEHRAEQSHHTVEDEILETVTHAIDERDGLSPDLEQMVAALPQLDDASLWRSARERLAEEISTRLEALNDKQQREGLTASEAAEHADLLHAYERVLLLRAEAAFLLKERGHDVAGLIGRG